MSIFRKKKAKKLANQLHIEQQKIAQLDSQIQAIERELKEIQANISTENKSERVNYLISELDKLSQAKKTANENVRKIMIDLLK